MNLGVYVFKRLKKLNSLKVLVFILLLITSDGVIWNNRILADIGWDLVYKHDNNDDDDDDDCDDYDNDNDHDNDDNYMWLLYIV